MNPSSSVQKPSFNSQAHKEPVRTRIKLLKFPLLVQLHILKLMRYTDTFTMSLCSTRMYNLIKTCKIKIARLCYKEYKNGFWVYNRLDENNNEYIIFISAVQKYKHDKDQIRVVYGGVSVDFQWRPWGIEYIDEDYGPIQRMTQNHINGLYQLSDVDLEFWTDNLQQGHYPDIRNVTDILIEGDKIKSDNLNEILQKHPNLKSLSVSYIDHPLPANSMLLNVEEVAIKGRGALVRNFLNNFSGRRAYLPFPELKASDVISCVADWISGRKYRNLAVLHIGIGLQYNIVSNLLRPLAKNTIMPDRYDGSFRYIGSRRFIGSREWLEAPGQFLHFERETDQKMATLVYSPYSSRLLVWD